MKRLLFTLLLVHFAPAALFFKLKTLRIMKSIRNLVLIFSFLFVGNIQAQWIDRNINPCSIMEDDHNQGNKNSYQNYHYSYGVWYYKIVSAYIVIKVPENWYEMTRKYPGICKDRVLPEHGYYSGEIYIPTNLYQTWIVSIQDNAFSYNRETGENYNPYLKGITFEDAKMFKANHIESGYDCEKQGVCDFFTRFGVWTNMPNLVYVAFEDWYAEREPINSPFIALSFGTHIEGDESLFVPIGGNIEGGTTLIVPDWAEYAPFTWSTVDWYKFNSRIGHEGISDLKNKINVLMDRAINIDTETTNSNNLSGYFANANTLILDNVEVNSIVNIYSISGILLNTIEATESNIVINGNFGNNQLYIVKNNNNCLKIK